MPVFVGAGTSSFMKGDGGVGFTRVTTTQRNAISGAVNGQVILNTTTGVLEYYDGSTWSKVSAVLAKLNTVTGNIFVGLAQNLTLAGEGFLSSNLVVRFVQSADSIDSSVTVTPSSDTAATVAVPAAVYNNVTAGRVVEITVTNSDNSTSSPVNKTALALPSGGNISTSGGYRIHTFNSSGTFVNTVASLSAEYLIVAGGGGAGQAGTSGDSGSHGGNGSASSITGSSVTYAGGGGGCGQSGNPVGSGGSGGGADGGNDVQPGTAATANRGGGGGGSRDYGTVGGGATNGGSGVVIVRYQL